MQQRNCDVCGAPYEAKRSTSRFCSPTCRVRNHQAGGSVPPVAAVPPPKADSDVLPPLVVAVVDELDKAGRLASAKGQLTLQLAVDLAGAGSFDNLSQRAAAVREIRASLDAALAGAKPPASALDDLERRRREKAAGA